MGTTVNTTTTPQPNENDVERILAERIVPRVGCSGIP